MSSKSKKPWNTEDLCRICDFDTLEYIVLDNVVDPKDEDEHDKLFNQIYSSTGLCRHCKIQEAHNTEDKNDEVSDFFDELDQ